MRLILLLIIGANVAWALPESFRMMAEKVVLEAPGRLQTLSQSDGFQAQGQSLDRRYWPTVELQSGYQYSDSPTNVFMQKLGERTFESSDFEIGSLNHPGYRGDWGSALSVGGLLWDNGGLSWQKKALEALRQAKLGESKALEGILLVRWSELYMRALGVAELKEYARTQYLELLKDLDEAKKLEEQGVVLGADVSLAQAMALGLAAATDKLEAEYRALKAGLAELYGEEIESLEKVELKDEIFSGKEGESYRVLASQRALEASEAMVKASQREDGPRVGWKVSEEFHVSGNDEGNATTAYVGGSWTIFNPQKPAKVAAAKAKRQEQAAVLEAAQRQVRKERELLAAQLETLESQLPRISKSVEELERSLELTSQLYKEGRKSIADVAMLRQKLLEGVEVKQRALAAYMGTRVAREENKGCLNLEYYLELWK